MLSEDVAAAKDYGSLKIINEANIKTHISVNEVPKIASAHIANKPFVVVAVPAFNEEVAIGSVVLRSKKYADKVIVIDDGSKDHTAEIAISAGAEVVPHFNNGGKGAAIKDAFTYAKKVNADILVLIDGDGQHNPDEIPVVIAPIMKGDADMVNGSRFLVQNGNHVPAYRRLGQEVLTFATNAGTNMHITDTQNGFRAFSKKTFDCFSFGQSGMAIESEMLMDAAKAEMRIKEVPIDVRYDVAKASTYNPIKHGLTVLGHIISLISERRPLLFFCVPGVILLAIGMVAAFMTFDSFNNTRNISIYYAMIGSACVIIGIFSSFTGLILNAITSTKKI
jgi:glycosyltransferase involved in cell wall biosynthesis